MSYAGDEGSEIQFSTARGRDWPCVRQFNVFVENRLGGLMRVVRCFDGTDIRIISLTVVDSADCAIIRLVLSDPERAAERFELARLPYTESNLLVVGLPAGRQPLVSIFKTLLVGEINIHYAYPLLIHPLGKEALALHVEDLEGAATTLKRQGFSLFTEGDFRDDG